MSFHKSKKFYFLFVGVLLSVSFFPTFLSGQTLGEKGRLVGIVKSDRLEILSGASVELIGQNRVMRSNISGEFEMDLLPGVYSLSSSYVGFTSKVIDSIIITSSKVTRVEIVLESPESTEAAVTVVASRKRETVSSVLKIQKNNIAVSDVISIEQIRRTPDNNVAQSLKRINGVTIVENKFIVVRGMGDRYNNVMLNGSQVPSTEPNKKNFSFDLLPSNLIDNIVVNKTSTPDLPADFAGGLIQLSTRDVPDKNTLFFSSGVGYNTLSTGNIFKSTRIDNREYFGTYSSDRKWFLKSWDPQKYFRLRSSGANNASAINKMNATIPNVWGLNKYTALPIQDYQLGGGFRRRFKNDATFGAIIGATYRNEQLQENYTRKGLPGDSTSGSLYNFNTNIGGIFSLAYTTTRSRISFKNTYSRRLIHDTYVFSGVDAQNNPQDNYSSSLTVNNLIQSRLEGDQLFSPKGIKLKWFADYSNTARKQPDNRYMKYFAEGTETYKIELGRPNEIGFGSIFTSDLKEKRYGGGADVSGKIKIFNRNQTLKGGILYNRRESEFISVFLRPTIRDQFDRNKFFGLPDYLLYTQENFREGNFLYQPLTTSRGSDADSYKGEQSLLAMYAMADIQILEKLRFIGGFRNENFDLSTLVVLSRDSSGKPLSDTAYKLRDNKIYPSFNLVYSLSERSNLRFAFSKTVSRFDFREFVNIRYTDFSIPADFYGNPRLKQPYVFNYDLRYEIFPTASEVVSLSVFYKKFTNPIEYLIDGPNASQTYSIFTLNQKSSTNIGVEFDFRKSLGFISKSSMVLKNFYISGNASLMESEVEIDRNEIFQVIGGTNTAYDKEKADTRKRALQGLSPYSVNAGILYQGKRAGFNFTYNRFGRRLLFAGAESFFDTHENPRDVLDLQIYFRVWKEKIEFKLNVSDIINDDFIQYNNSTASRGPVEANSDPKGDAFDKNYDFELYRAKRGVNISFSMNFKF